MKQIVGGIPSRNLMVFEAPVELTNKTKQLAEQEMCSMSAICRRALNELLSANEADKRTQQYISY